MVLGDTAYERGAWANRIGESEVGVGYLLGEGIREPLRVRAGWVPDDDIKALESFVTGTTPDYTPGTVLQLAPSCPGADLVADGRPARVRQDGGS
jgi:S-DNA-T family DNA segregation ATPase FtsK/SpoIIIE